MASVEETPADGRLARSLQEAELGQRTGEEPRGEQTQEPVLQGVPVAGAQEPEGPVLQGVPVAEADGGPVVLGVTGRAGRPRRGAGVATIGEPSASELVILDHRAAVSCFATMDVVTTLMTGLSLLHGPLWGTFGFVLLVGPVCGLVGASSLNRCLVGLYLTCCIAKVVFELATAYLMGVLVTWAFLWIGAIAVVQLWILKMVATFWSALGDVSPQRRRELAGAKESAAPPSGRGRRATQEPGAGR
mmetsp:Transcript_137055/g.425865  ORF Transcript_137055/g.425865 Transcript_137055/m.425865 type:complete len:246 (+) Transcript_137055:54-791(+)